MNESMVWLTIFVLAVFVGIEVISKVSVHPAHPADVGRQRDPRGDPGRGDPGRRHGAQSTPILVLGLVAVVLATINMVGGFVVTDRMLVMFSGPSGGSTSRTPGARPVTPVWAQLGYLVAAVCFILALKGLSSPRTARRGNLIGAAGAVLACVMVFLVADLQHLVPILVAHRHRHRGRVLGAYRVQMTQMPQLVALFNGVGGGAAAIVALDRAAPDSSRRPEPPVFDLVATAFTIVVGSVSFAGSIVTFLKLQELMTTRPVVFRRLPDPVRPRPARRRSVSVSAWSWPRACSSACCWPSSAPASACCWCCRSAARTCRSSSRCSTRSPA